jgi:hypothetical protein
MKQTAVDYIKEKLQGYGFDFGYVLDVAKEMEKEQIESSYHNGATYALISQSDLALSKGKFPTPEQYYNETFNKSINDKG